MVKIDIIVVREILLSVALLSNKLSVEISFSSSSSSSSSFKGNRNIKDTPPIRTPFELMVRFLYGSYDLKLGKPGGIGNMKSKGRATTITKILPFTILYHGKQ
jgi:hypothetical protein